MTADAGRPREANPGTDQTASKDRYDTVSAAYNVDREMFGEPVESTPNSYATAAPVYVAAGWRGVIPLPPGQKWPPPTGYTGAEGAWPDATTIAAWSDDPDKWGNVGLRLPDDVVGIDVDHYGAKVGGDTIADAEKRYGPLPPTWVSSAREWPSGIRLYAVPSGGHYVTPGRDVDIIQSHHRYACVWPSTNPATGSSYRWMDPDGTFADRPPRADELTELPAAWVVGLTKPAAMERTTSAGISLADDRHPAVDRALANALAGMYSNRHDNATAGVMAVVRLRSLDYPGADVALSALRDAFVAQVTGDGSRSDGVAEQEWTRMVSSADEKARSTPATIPMYEPWTRPADPDWNVGPRSPGELEPAQLPESSWAPVNLADVAQNPPEPARWLRRDDGVALLYPGRTHWIIGESESLKTWLALVACREVVTDAGRVLFVDFEDEARTFLERLRALGVADPDLFDDEHVRFVRPDEPAPGRWVAELAAWAPDLVVVDGVTGAFDIEAISPDSGVDVGRWQRQILLPFARAGAAVVALDHVTKSKETRGRYAIGSVHKLNGVTGAAYLVESVRPLSRASLEPVEGLVRVTVAKDRPGWVRASVPGGKGPILDAAFTAYPDGGVTVHLTKPGKAGSGPDDEYGQRIAAHLAIYPGSTKGALRALGNSDAVDAAAAEMVTAGLVDVTEVGTAHKHHLTLVGKEHYGAEEAPNE